MDGERFPSGRWTGYYQQNGVRCPQLLQLEFANGVLRGDGIDVVGPFHVRGTYDANGGDDEVRWTKTYAFPSAPVSYRGFRQGKGIWGTWEIPPLRSGFHIWPVAAGGADAEAAANAATTTVTASAPATASATATAAAVDRASASAPVRA